MPFCMWCQDTDGRHAFLFSSFGEDQTCFFWHSLSLGSFYVVIWIFSSVFVRIPSIAVCDFAVHMSGLVWTPGRAKSPRSSPQPVSVSPVSTPPDSPVSACELPPIPIQPPQSAFLAPPAQSFAFQVSSAESFRPAIPPSHALPGFAPACNNESFMKLASDVWNMPHSSQSANRLPHVMGFPPFFEDFSGSESPPSGSDASSSCGSPYSDVFPSAEDDLLGPLLDQFLDSEHIASFSNQATAPMPQ